MRKRELKFFSLPEKIKRSRVRLFLQWQKMKVSAETLANFGFSGVLEWQISRNWLVFSAFLRRAVGRPPQKSTFCEVRRKVGEENTRLQTNNWELISSYIFEAWRGAGVAETLYVDIMNPVSLAPQHTTPRTPRAPPLSSSPSKLDGRASLRESLRGGDPRGGSFGRRGCCVWHRSWRW